MKKLSRLLNFFLAIVLAVTVVAAPLHQAVADPLPESEIKALNNYPNWVANACQSDSASVPVSAGTGAPDGAQFPSLDPTSMANSIDTFIKKENPNSKLNGLGATIVASAQHSNVSPFLIVAIAHEESNLSDPSDYNVANGNNSFGREATPSQPHFSGAHLWYRWSSVKASVDYTAEENQNASGGGDMASYLRAQYGNSIDGSDLASLFLEYAPPSENDTAGYIANVEGWVEQLVKGAGGVVASPTAPVPSGATDTSSSCCGSSGGASDVNITGNNAKDAFNYFIGPPANLSPAAAAGLVGNFMQESGTGLDTHADNGSHVGIAQWDASSRWPGLLSHEKGKDPYALATQLDYVWYELNSSYKSAVLDPLKNAKSADEAAQIVFDSYEVAGDSSLPNRQAYAKKVLSQYGGGVGGGGAVGVDVTAGACGSDSGTPVSTTGYQNPLRDVKNLGRGRIDMGVDYTGSGPIYAIGNGTVANLSNSGWPAGTFISYKLDDGPAKGRYVYVAENCKPIKVHIGQKVDSNTVLCDMIDESPHIEIGWAEPPGAGDTIAIHNGGYVEGKATASGENFNSLLVSLGAPSGTQQSQMGSLPANWPTW